LNKSHLPEQQGAKLQRLKNSQLHIMSNAQETSATLPVEYNLPHAMLPSLCAYEHQTWNPKYRHRPNGRSGCAFNFHHLLPACPMVPTVKAPFAQRKGQDGSCILKVTTSRGTKETV
jgi:hypothetical protein